MALTAGKAAKLNHISRTALLYYDQTGLVSPSQRSAAGYRLYSDADLERLKTVLEYRAAGIPLEDIARLLSGAGNSPEAVLFKRLDELNAEIIALKKRQAAVIGILQSIPRSGAEVSKASWRSALEESGITGGRADKLHADFEENSPQMHERFLRALGFDQNEVRLIRAYYGKGGGAEE